MNSGLLSRIAETLFWIGRYVERADDTARMVDVYAVPAGLSAAQRDRRRSGTERRGHGGQPG